MRIDIVENSGQRLRLAIGTSVPLYAFFGLMFIGLGLVCIRLLAVETRIVVEPQGFTYTNTCLWLFDCGTVQSAAQDVRSVALVGHEIEVQLPDGAHRLALPHSDGDEKAAIARDIEAALSQPASSFRHVEGSPIASLLVGLVCIGSGLLIVSAMQRVNLFADRATGSLVLSRRLLLWPIERTREIDLANLEAVHAVPCTLQTFRHVVTSYSVRLQARGQRLGEAVSLTFLPMFTQADANHLAQIIGRWIR